MNRRDACSSRVRVFEGDGRLEFRTRPVSIVSGLVMLGFVVAFVVLAARGVTDDVQESLSATGLVVLALGLLVPAVWVLSHQRLALSADGLVATRSVLGVPIRRRRFPLPKVGPARSLFSHAGGDESPDVYVLEIQVAPQPIRFSNECSEEELKQLAHQFNAFRYELAR